MTQQITMDYEHPLHNPEFENWTAIDALVPLPELATWIHQHCEGKVVMRTRFAYFESEAEALLFKLSFPQRPWYDGID